MKETIEFKKDCMLKTYVSSISDITLSHDYKILVDTIEGYFDVAGSYKATMSSVEKEDFFYTIPFTIALSSLIDKDSINLSIHDFSYETEKDVLHLKMVLDMEYSKLPEEVNNEETGEKEMEEVNDVIDDYINEKDLLSPKDFHDEVMLDKTSTIKETNNEITDDNMKTIFNNVTEEEYSKFKVYIMREEDTLDSILLKYNVKIDDITDYNDVENIHVGDKIIIPIIKNEEN
mgnify:FL=1